MDSDEDVPDTAGALIDPRNWLAEQDGVGDGGTGSGNFALVFPFGPPFGYVALMTEKTDP